jgi:acetylornithine/N-succinyldiaminopimelate aminotransferase
MTQRELFLRHVAQTSGAPLGLEIVKAEGSLLYDVNGKEYIDLIGGISVANIGHRHPAVTDAIKKQLDAYLHIMVYGEFIESPQVQYASLLAKHLPASLDSVYFTNSGAEATEGAMKLAKRVTGRMEIVACSNGYHGSTQGALSIIGNEYWRNAFRPLIPGIRHIAFNGFDDLDLIDDATAAVIVETVQAESAVLPATKEWIQALRETCNRTGALLIFDEIQAGFGRTGTLWAFESYDVVPDVLLLGKALGGGMPLGAFIAARELMQRLTENPVLGHITTFGGHPVSCAAGIAAFKILIDEKLWKKSQPSNGQFRRWRSVNFSNFDSCKRVIDHCIENGVLTDWFLFAPECLRISPPLNIPDDLFDRALGVVKQAADKFG